MQRLPLHPRLARILLAAGGADEAALACAVLSERHYASAASHATSNDLLTIVENRAALPAHVTRVARQLSSLVARRPSQHRRAQASGARCLRAIRTASRGGVRRDRRKCCSRQDTAPTSAPRAACGTGSSWSRSTSRRRRRRDARKPAFAWRRSSIGSGWSQPTCGWNMCSTRRRRPFAPWSVSTTVRSCSPSASCRLSADAAASMLADVYVQRRLGADDQQLLRRLRFAGIERRRRRPGAGRRIRQAIARRHPDRRRAQLGAAVAARARCAGEAAAAERPFGAARVPRRRLGRRAGQAAGDVRRARDADDRRRARSRCCSRCWRRTDGRCSSPAICGASGSGPIRRCGRSCAAATRSTSGRRSRRDSAVSCDVMTELRPEGSRQRRRSGGRLSTQLPTVAEANCRVRGVRLSCD